MFDARMAELADALASGASVREDVQVQVLFRALWRPNLKRFGLFLLSPGVEPAQLCVAY